jgi:hypothetical protein
VVTPVAATTEFSKPSNLERFAVPMFVVLYGCVGIFFVIPYSAEPLPLPIA